MPIYEYRCRKCGSVFSHHFRTLQAVEDKAPSCPACGAHQVQRLLSTVALLSGGETSAGEAVGGTATAAKSRLFGRKELEQVLEQRRRTG